MGKLDQIYAKLPTWTQHFSVSAFGLYWYWLRFGSGYSQYLQDYMIREAFTATDWQKWQKAEIASLLKAAATYVPYYRSTWAASERRAALAGHLEDIPLLGKEPLRDNPADFLRQDINPGRKLVFHTSGTSGTPIASIWTIPELRMSLAVREARSARWAGTSFRLPRGTFSGRMVEPDPNSKGPYYRFNLVERQAYLSAFHLRPDTANDYLTALRRHRIQWLTGYAVSYYLLAKFIIEKNLEVPPLRAVVTTSEKVTPEMRKVMEAAYRCRVYEEYSTVENALFASECEQGRLHVSPDVGIIEILRPDGSLCEMDEPGDVAATCLMRTYQPLIRYRLGDVAAWDSQPCPCGRSMPVIKEVIGRIEDVVIGPDGRRMVRFHGIFVNQPHVREGQIIQEALDRIRVKVVPSDGFSKVDESDIMQRIQQRLGPQVNVVVELVNHIPRTTAGKFQAVKSLLRSQGVAEAEQTGLANRD